MKEKNLNLPQIILCMYLLLESRFFYLIPNSELYSGFNYKNKTLIALFCIVAFVLLIVKEKKITIDKRIKWIFLLLLYILFEVIRNVYKYDLTLYESFSIGHGFLLLLLYPILILNSDENSQRKTINTITIFSIILSTLFLTQSFAYKLWKITFLHIKEYPLLKLLEVRSYGIRMTAPGTLIIFSVLISLGQIINKNKKMHIINCVLGMLYIVLVCQTRMTTLAVIASFMLVLANKIFEKKFKHIKKIIILVIAVFIFVLPYKMSDIFEDRTSGSVYARIYAIELYTKSFLKNPVFGVGCLPNDTTKRDIALIMHGPKGYAHTTDVGYVAYIFQFGVVGAIILLILISNIIKILKNVKNKNAVYYSTILCLLYILLTFGTLSIFDTQRIVILPIILYMLNCIEANERNLN